MTNNRHTRRAMAKHQRKLVSRTENKQRTLHTIGYRGQDYEVRCWYGDNRDYRVGWASTKEGIAAMVRMVLSHPHMENPQVIKLTDADKKRLFDSERTSKVR